MTFIWSIENWKTFDLHCSVVWTDLEPNGMNFLGWLQDRSFKPVAPCLCKWVANLISKSLKKVNTDLWRCWVLSSRSFSSKFLSKLWPGLAEFFDSEMRVRTFNCRSALVLFQYFGGFLRRAIETESFLVFFQSAWDGKLLFIVKSEILFNCWICCTVKRCEWGFWSWRRFSGGSWSGLDNGLSNFDP